MRTLRRLSLALLVGAVAIGLGSACARAGTGGSTPPASGSGEATSSATPTQSAVAVTITRSGGFAGVNQTIAVAADGTWVYTDAKQAKNSERGTLAQAQRLELARLATAPQLFAELAPTPEPTPCADAFSFVIDVNGRSAGFADCGRHPRPAVDALLAFLADATPF